MAKNYESAISYSSQAISIGVSDFLAYYIKGISLFNLGEINKSISIVNEGLGKYDNQTDLLAVLGGCLISQNDYDKAESILLKALLANKNNGLAYSHLSWMYFNQRKFSKSLAAANKALEIQPGDSGAKCNKASCMKEMRQVEEAIKLYKEVINQNPKMNTAWVGLLFTIIFSEKYDPIEHANLVRSYVKTIKKTTTEEYIFESNDSKKLRIGILSEDIRAHPCAYMLVPFIANINKDIASVNVYCLNKTQDSVTLKIKNLSNKFLDLSDLNDNKIIKLIRDDQLHVLIDLGGYTGTSPLRYMVNKLAKFQCSWLGYPASSQMEEIDFRIADSFGNIPAQDINYTETLLKNKHISTTYTPLVYKPLMVYESKYSIKESPFKRNGYVTFGSCNNLGKVSNNTIKIWSEILASVPNSKILIEADNLDVSEVKSDLLSGFNKFEINSERIIFLKRDTENQYLTYNFIDIALDTTPLTGGTTTFDCLWMGVPVITKIKEYFHTRMSGVILNAVGLNELVCSTDEEYVNTAIKLSNDLDKLSKIRYSLRLNYEKSPVMDHSQFTNWFLSSIYSKVNPGSVLEIPNENENLYFGGDIYPIEMLKEIIIHLMGLNEFSKLLILMENMSAKWSKHWIVAYTLSEIDRLQGRIDESFHKLVLSIKMNQNSKSLNRLLLERTGEIREDFIKFHYSRDRSFSKDLFQNMQIPNFRETLIEGKP